MQGKAATVAQYLSELPPERRDALQAVRRVLLANLDPDFEEGMQYGMIGYYVPHRVYPPGYHCDPRQPLPFAGLASQKHHMSFYYMAAYGDGADSEWLREQFAQRGKKLDMGKCCIRFRKLDDLPLDVIGEAVRRVPVASFVSYYETAIRTRPTRRSVEPKSARSPRAKPVRKPGKRSKPLPAKRGASKRVVKKKAASKRGIGGKSRRRRA